MDITRVKTIAGMDIVRVSKGPASWLAEVVNDKGSHHMAIVFEDQFKNHRALTESFDAVSDFLRTALVYGVSRLAFHEPENGIFGFNTGKCWSLAESTRALADMRIQPGPRAGLELMKKAGKALIDASEVASRYAIASHGGLTPWRILLRQDANVQIIGYAIPQVEIINYEQTGHGIPSEDSFRYCPPERIRGDTHSENITSDLFALGLIGFELMTTQPMYNGLLDVIRQKAAQADVAAQLYAHQRLIPPSVRDFLIRVLQPNHNHRYPSGQMFLDEIDRLLMRSDIKGMSLYDVVNKVSSSPASVAGKKIESVNSATMIFNREDALKNAGVQPQEEEPIRQQVEIPSRKQDISMGNEDVGAVETPQESQKEEVSNRSKLFTSSKKPLWSKINRARSVATEEEKPQVSKNQTKTAAENLVDLFRSHKSFAKKEEAPPLQSKPIEVDKAREVMNAIKHSQIEPIKQQPEKVVKQQKATEEEKEQQPKISPPVIGPEVVAPQQIKKEMVPLNKPVLDKEADVATTPFTKAPAVSKVSPPQNKVKSDISFVGMTDFDAPILSFPPLQTKGKIATFSFSRGDGSSPVRFKSTKTAKSGDVIGGLLNGRLLPIRTDLTGQICGWYRFGTDDGGWATGGTLMQDLLTEAPLEIRTVPNNIIWADVSVHSDKPYRMMTQVGTSVPVLSLIDHLVLWLQLPRKHWVLYFGTKKMGYYDILADYLSHETTIPQLALKEFRRG